MEFIWLWMGVMFPLVFSPGPANLVFATSGASVGFIRSLPLVFGVDLVFILQSVLVGFGFGTVLQSHPIILQSFQMIGAIYLVYLATGFLKTTKSAELKNSRSFSFVDGVVVQILNAKGWVMIALMYSLFSVSSQEVFGSASVIALIVMLAILNISVHLVWVKLGATLQLLMTNEKMRQRMDYFYAFSLLLVAAWLIIDNSIWY